MGREERRFDRRTAGAYRVAAGNVARVGEHFRVTLKQRASKGWERIETTEVSEWVRRAGSRARLAIGTAKPTRSPRVNGGKEKQQRVNTLKGRKVGGEEGIAPCGKQKKTKPKSGKKEEVRKKSSKNDGERTINKRRVDNESKMKRTKGS